MELSLGKKIRALRKARGITQEELANALENFDLLLAQ